MRKTEPVTTRAVATVPAQLLLTYIWSRNHTYIVATAPTMTGRVFNADSEFFVGQCAIINSSQTPMKSMVDMHIEPRLPYSDLSQPFLAVPVRRSSCQLSVFHLDLSWIGTRYPIPPNSGLWDERTVPSSA